MALVCLPVLVVMLFVNVGCGQSMLVHNPPSIALSSTPDARFFTDLNHAGITCFMMYGNRRGTTMAIVATVQVTVADESAAAYKAIGEKTLAVARTYGGVALGANTLDVRIVSVSNHHTVLDEQTFPLPVSPSSSQQTSEGVGAGVEPSASRTRHTA